MRKEEITARAESRIDSHLQPLPDVGVEVHRLTREGAVDARAPLLA